MSKTRKIIYWVATIWLCLGLFSTGLVQLLKGETGTGSVETMHQLGYPVYLMALLGIWKLLAVPAILLPGLPRLKEWAYAGCFFVVSGAIYSHIAAAEPLQATLPALLLLILTIASWYLRPLNRKFPVVFS